MNVSKYIYIFLPLYETLMHPIARDNNTNITKLTYKAGQSSQSDDSIYQEPPNTSPSAGIFRSTAINRTYIILTL